MRVNNFLLRNTNRDRDRKSQSLEQMLCNISKKVFHAVSRFIVDEELVNQMEKAVNDDGKMGTG